MHSKSRINQTVVNPAITVSAEKAAEAFPSARYFQIHFEFLQEQMQLTMRMLEALQAQMRQLEQQLPVKTDSFANRDPSLLGSMRTDQEVLPSQALGRR